MREWAMVALAGGAGGTAAIVFAGNPPGAFWATAWALVRNALGGCIASLILWGIYTSNDTFDSTSFRPGEVFESFVIGLGGVEAVRRYMHERGAAHEWREATQRASGMLQEMLPSLVDPSSATAHTEPGGATDATRAGQGTTGEGSAGAAHH